MFAFLNLVCIISIVYIYIYCIYIHTYIYIYICSASIYIYIYIYICIVYIHICTDVYSVYIYIYVHMYVYTFTWSYMYAMHLHILIFWKHSKHGVQHPALIGQVSLQRKGFLSIAQSIAQHRGLSLGPLNIWRLQNYCNQSLQFVSWYFCAAENKHGGGHFTMVRTRIIYIFLGYVLYYSTHVKRVLPLFTTAHY